MFLFYARASVLRAITGWKEGMLARGSNWASLANLTDWGIMLQFMQVSSLRASRRWSTPRQAPQCSASSGGQAAAPIVLHGHMDAGSPQGALKVWQHREKECLPSTANKTPDQVGRGGGHAPVTNQVMSWSFPFYFFLKINKLTNKYMYVQLYSSGSTTISHKC